MVKFYNTDLKIEKDISIRRSDALLVIDMQNDFIPGGNLAVDEGDHIISGINKLIPIFVDAYVVHTQDWHPPDHLSFASNHSGKNPGDEFSSKDGAIGPVLWPDHCVQNTYGARFHRDINTRMINKIIQKGMNPKVDSYSGFLENDKKTETGLKAYLNSVNVKRIFICGLALDYCCYNTAMDGIELGFDTYFIVDLTRGVNLPPGNIDTTLTNMKKKKVKFVIQKSINFW